MNNGRTGRSPSDLRTAESERDDSFSLIISRGFPVKSHFGIGPVVSMPEGQGDTGGGLVLDQLVVKGADE